LIFGTLAAGVLLLLYDTAAESMRLLLAAGAGLGCMAATTAGNVVATLSVPEGEWEGRIALLQRFTSAGQVIGLVAAGVLIKRFPGSGFVCAGLALIAAGVLALVAVPARDRSAPRGDGGLRRLQRLKAALAVIDRPMRRFLLIWLIAYCAMNGFAALFPVAMTRQYGMDPVLPAGAYALGVGSSLVLYRQVGAATHRLGSGRVLIAGFAARAALLVILAGLGFSHGGGTGWLVLFGFALVQFVWPLIAVAANSLSVRLAPAARGESVGLFNAATSLASAIGAALAGAVFAGGGFAALAAATLAAVLAGLALAQLWLRQPHPVAVGIGRR
jgi:predicted MFS family arabinose efflux permease